MTVDEVVGRNVHQLIWDRRLKARDLYGPMNLSRSSLAKKMRGEVTWSASDVVIVAQVLGVSPGELFAGFQTGVENTAPEGLPHLDSNQKPADYPDVTTLERIARPTLTLIYGERESA